MIPDDALLNWIPADRSEAQALVGAVRTRASGRGVTLPEPPVEPISCCGRGCTGCVWETYYGELRYWRDAAVLSWAE